jgi:O-antigen/teichoic acid export membrane protein/glycosyltransferase involved in cell wall biosynthesis
MEAIRNRNLGKSVIVVGITAAVSQLLSIGYLVFLARWLGPETYALHVGVFNLCAISVFLVNWGLDTWLLKASSEDLLSGTRILKTVLLLKLGFGVLWAVALYVVAPLLRPDIFLRNLLALAILSTLFESLTNSIYTVFLTSGRFKQSSAILLIGRLFRIGTLIGLYFLSVNNLSTIISARTLIDLIVLVVAGLVFGLSLEGWKPEAKTLKNTFTDAVPFHASDLINIIFRHVDVTLVTFLSKSLTTISNYSLMISFFNVISTIILSLINVVVPSLSKDRDRPVEARKKTLLRTIFGFFLLGLAGWAIISLFGRQAIHLVLGDQYAMVADFISRTAVIVLISSLNVGLTAIIIVNNRQKERVFPQIVSLVLKVTASLLLFPVWQVEGLRWVYILSEVLLSLGYFLVISGVFKELSETKAASGKAGEKLKIALIAFNQEGKGTYLRAYFLGKELVRLGHQVTILAAGIEGKRITERMEDGLQIVTFPRLLKGLFLSGWGFDEVASRLAWARHNKFDLVHAFECRPTNYFLARQLQKQGALCFTDWADWLGKGGSVEERTGGFKKRLLRNFETHFENKRFQKSDGITAICSTLLDEAVRRGYPPDKILLLPNGMRNPYLKSYSVEIARARKGLQEECLIVGYLGSGFKQDMDLMYSAFRLLQGKVGDVTLLHVGRSNYHTQPDESIIHTGPVSYEDVSLYLSACDIFWFPLRKNNANLGRLPLKFSDYLTIGRPIISTDVGDLAAWVRCLQVGLVAEDDAESISEHVLDIIRSPEQKAVMSKNARLASENYELSWEKRAKELESFYFSQMDRSRKLTKHGKNEVQMLQ